MSPKANIGSVYSNVAHDYVESKKEHIENRFLKPEYPSAKEWTPGK